MPLLLLLILLMLFVLCFVFVFISGTPANHFQSNQSIPNIQNSIWLNPRRNRLLSATTVATAVVTAKTVDCERLAQTDYSRIVFCLSEKNSFEWLSRRNAYRFFFIYFFMTALAVCRCGFNKVRKNEMNSPNSRVRNWVRTRSEGKTKRQWYLEWVLNLVNNFLLTQNRISVGLMPI